MPPRRGIPARQRSAQRQKLSARVDRFASTSSRQEMAAKRGAKSFDKSAIPLFVGLVLIGLLVGSRWFLNPPVMATDGIVIVVIGFFYLLRIRFSLLRRGFWKNSDPTETTDVEPRSYKTAFVILAIGVFLVWLGNSAMVNPPP